MDTKGPSALLVDMIPPFFILHAFFLTPRNQLASYCLLSFVPFPECHIMESYSRYRCQTGFFHFIICIPPRLFMT